MRLTNVSQMQAQPGEVLSCAVSVSLPDDSPDARLPISFDQRRHVGFGSRPGSWMAVSFSLPDPASLPTIAEAWREVLQRHHTLRSVFSQQQGELQLRQVEVEDLEWERVGPADTSEEARRLLREHFDRVCESFAQPSHRLCVIADEAGMRTRQVVIGSDHAHVDAWSLLVLVRDLAVCVDNLQAGRAAGEGLPEPESFAAHTAMMEARPSPPAEIVSRWEEILDAGDRAMPTFPLDLGDLSGPVDEVVEIRDVFDTEELAFIEDHAREHGVRLIAVAVSVMTRLAGELAGEPLRTVFPVHSRDEERWFGSVGWFITNSVMENADESYAGAYSAVKEAIRLGSYPLGPIMEPYGGMPQEPGMFAVSWLDHRRLPVNVSEELDPQHVSAVIRTDGVMIWFVVNESGLHLRCRYPRTRQAKRAMRTWLAGLVYGLRAPLENGGEGLDR